MAEVIHRLEEAGEETLVGRRSRRASNGVEGSNGFSESSSNVELKTENGQSFHKEDDEEAAAEGVEDNGSFEKSVYYDKNGGAIVDASFSEISPALDGLHTILKKLDIQEIKNSVINHEAHGESSSGVVDLLQKSTPEEKIRITSLTKEGIKHLKFDLIEESEEEVIELEFERPVEKPHSHDVYCPKCNSSITKVVIRRRKRIQPSPSSRPLDLFGCLSCFSIFLPSGRNGNVFPFLGKEKKNNINTHTVEIPSTDQNVSAPDNINNKGNVLDGKGTDQNISPDIKGKKMDNQANDKSPLDESHPSYEDSLHINDKGPVRPANDTDGESQNAKTHPSIPEPGYIPPEVAIDIKQPGDSTTDVVEPQVIPEVPRSVPLPHTHSSKPLEILKSIVYGGLTETITSLSIVSSAAASDVTTLNILALALANLFGGFFIFFHNLKELKNEHPGYISHSTNRRVDRYQELLGQRENFLLHFTVAVLSFILFGLIPPVTYGFSFYKSDDRDFKLMALVAASLFCVVLLSIGKAFIQRPPKTTSMYFKTISYYVIAALMASGASYAAGNLFKRLMEKLGLFDTNAGMALSLPNVNSVNPSWASL